ncbi:MAG TPA: EscU/YscU/HrcU family type III secretion system export apparatus switch protein [Polyangiaceae bacterium]|nr:EscU/YscU/HrcU family type III secretion system export apparatus switch protein [Polyangiaceae bacterium]
MSDKTEEATPRRLRRAREEGDSGASGYASQAVAFVVAVAIAPGAVAALVSAASAGLRDALARAGGGGLDGHALAVVDGPALARTFLGVAVPFIAAVGVAGAAAQLVQTGGVLASSRLAPRFERLDVFAGVGNLFSGARLFAVGRALVAALVVAWLAVHDLGERIVDVARLAGRPSWAPVVVGDVAVRFLWHAALVGLVLAVADALVMHRAWRARLRMTKEEVRRDYREAEGDPMMRAARRRAYEELLAQATIASIRTATVVVVNPTHLACALRYDDSGKEGERDEAPVVIASGEGDLAARIAQAAREWGIPVVRDVPLARALVELEVGTAIPEALYEAVAEILRDLQETERG